MSILRNKLREEGQDQEIGEEFEQKKKEKTGIQKKLQDLKKMILQYISKFDKTLLGGD
jgi:hypothetical protein